MRVLVIGALRRIIVWEQTTHPPGALDPEEFDYATEDAALAGLGR